MNRRIFGVMGGSLLVSMFALATVAMLGRALGPGGVGEYQAIIRWTAIGTTLFGLSLGQSSAFMSSRPGVAFSSLVLNAVAVAAVQAAALGLVGYFLAPTLYASNPIAIQLGRLFLLFVPLALLSDYLGQLARVRLKIHVFNGARMIQGATQTSLVFMLVALGRVSLSAVLVVALVSYALGLAVLGSYSATQHWFAGRLDLGLLRRTLSYAVRVHPGAEARELNLYLDQLMMSVMLPLVSLGLYASAVSASTVLRVGSSAFLLLAQAEIQAVPADERIRVAIHLNRLNVAIMLPSALLLAVAMPVLLPFAYGPAFSPAVWAAQILCFAVLIEGSSVAMWGVLVGIGRGGVAAFWQLASLGVSFVALLIWLPVGQIVAAAWISLISYTIGAVGMTVTVSRALSVPVRELVLPKRLEIVMAARRALRLGAVQ